MRKYHDFTERAGKKKNFFIIINHFAKRCWDLVNNNQGQLLLEIIVIVGILAVVGTIIAQLIVAGTRAGQNSSRKLTALNLARETLEAVEGASFEKWQNLYALDKQAEYHATSTGGRWSIVSGRETVPVSGVVYTRFFTIDDVCRGDASREIVVSNPPPCNAGSSADPSTQLVTVTVSWPEGELGQKQYLTRWRNQICSQTDWSGNGSGVATCPTSLYGSAVNIDTSGKPGSLQLDSN